jgi:hemoglobin
MTDLATTDDITHFMNKFYEQLLADPSAAPVFEGIDMQAHMPRIVAFWENLLFGGGRYSGSPFDRHVPLDLKKEHFEIWYRTFCGVLNGLYAGPKASLLKERAHSIAFIFSHKLGLEVPDIHLDLSSINLRMCQALIGHEFVRRNDAGPDVVLRLTAAESAESGTGGGPFPDRPFRLVFLGPADPQLTQGMHDLDHPNHEFSGLFLVPTGPDGDGFQYEAVFN